MLCTFLPFSLSLSLSFLLCTLRMAQAETYRLATALLLLLLPLLLSLSSAFALSRTHHEISPLDPLPSSLAALNSSLGIQTLLSAQVTTREEERKKRRNNKEISFSLSPSIYSLPLSFSPHLPSLPLSLSVSHTRTLVGEWLCGAVLAAVSVVHHTGDAGAVFHCVLHNGAQCRTRA